MAFQTSVCLWQGTIDNLTGVRKGNEYHLRRKSSLDADRFWTDPAFENSRKQTTPFGRGSNMAAALRQHLTHEKKKYYTQAKVGTRIKELLTKTTKTEVEILLLMARDMDISIIIEQELSPEQIQQGILWPKEWIQKAPEGTPSQRRNPYQPKPEEVEKEEKKQQPQTKQVSQQPAKEVQVKKQASPIPTIKPITAPYNLNTPPPDPEELLRQLEQHHAQTPLPNGTAHLEEINKLLATKNTHRILRPNQLLHPKKE